jgi:predicted nucleic acid-binding protein
MLVPWICVDASLVIPLVADPADTAIENLWDGWIAAGRTITAPRLLYYEVANGLYRCIAPGTLTAEAVRQALAAVLALPIQINHDVELHNAAVAMAARFSLPAAYDAHYLALSERLGAEFWTADRRLVRAVQAALPWVRLAGDE